MSKQDSKYDLNHDSLKPCPFCSGKLYMYIYDDTGSKYISKNDPMWKGGAHCKKCGIGIQAGYYGWGIDIDRIEKMIIQYINRRS